MARELRIVAGSNGPLVLLDGLPLDLVGEQLPRITESAGGGRIWFNSDPQFDISFFSGLEVEPRFTVPPEASQPDWYERLEQDRYAFVDWDDDAAISASPILSQVRVMRHPGRQAIAWVHRFDRVNRIAYRNAGELLKVLRATDDTETALQLTSVDNRQMHEEYLNEVERLLHNAVAAMKTRVDQQRRLVDQKWKPPRSWMELELAPRRRSLGNEQVVRFFHDLRNYMLHRDLPVAGSTATFGPEVFEVSYTLEAQDLLKWDGWSPEGKDWIRGQGERVKVAPALQTYLGLTGEFDIWLRGEYVRAHQEVIAAHDVLEAEHFRLFGAPA